MSKLVMNVKEYVVPVGVTIIPEDLKNEPYLLENIPIDKDMTKVLTKIVNHMLHGVILEFKEVGE